MSCIRDLFVEAEAQYFPVHSFEEDGSSGCADVFALEQVVESG